MFAAAQVPRRQRSRREESMERTEGQVVVLTPSGSTGNGDGDGALVVSTTSSDRNRTPRVRPRETTTVAAAADRSVLGGNGGGSVDVADGDSNNAEKEQRRKEEFDRERRRKGKMVAEEESPSTASGGGMPIGLPAADKLMGDAIRGGRRQHVTTAIGTCKNTKRRGHGKFWASLGRDGASTSSAGSDMVVPLDDIAVVHDRLRSLLNGLGAVSPPVRVYGKMMWRSDRLKSQNRLQISRKKDGELSPFDSILTLAEKSAATSKRKKKSSKPKNKKNGESKEKKDEHKEYNDNGTNKPNNEPNNGDDGLFVQAYDRTGEEYILTLKYIKANNSYRLMGRPWKTFLKNCSLTLQEDAKKKGKKAIKKVKKVAIANEAMIDLWVFRSQKLSHGKDDHNDGRLGLVMVHYFKGDAPHADAAFKANEELLLLAPKKRKKKHEGESSSHDAVTEALPQEEPNVVTAVELEIAAVMAGETGVQGGAPEPHHGVEVVMEGVQLEIRDIDLEVLLAAQTLFEMKNSGRR